MPAAFELMPGVTAVELARRRFPARVLLARRTPEHVSGVECCGVDVALLHGWPAWLPGLRWQAITQGLQFRDIDQMRDKPRPNQTASPPSRCATN